MSVLVLGGTGQLGRAFVGRFPAPTRLECDLTRPETVQATLERYQPTWVINAAAQHDARRAEHDPRPDYAVNAAAPRMLARACTARQIRLVHLSTNYVFGGDSRRGPFTEADPPAPTTMYGVAKWAGERGVLDADPQHLVVRTAALYGPGRADGFPGKYVLAGTGPLRVVRDQWISPTSATDLARALLQLIEMDAPGGLYHLSGAGEPVTWADYAATVLAIAGHRRALIPVTTEEFGEGVPRPAHSHLRNTRAAALGVTLRAWPDALADFLRAE